MADTETKQPATGLQQSGAPPKAPKPEEDKNPIPPSLRGHKAVPSHHYVSLQNSECDFDMNTKPKSMDELIAANKAKKVSDDKAVAAAAEKK